MKARIEKLHTGAFVLRLEDGTTTRPYPSAATLKRRFRGYEIEAPEKALKKPKAKESDDK